MSVGLASVAMEIVCKHRISSSMETLPDASLSIIATTPVISSAFSKTCKCVIDATVRYFDNSPFPVPSKSSNRSTTSSRKPSLRENQARSFSSPGRYFHISFSSFLICSLPALLERLSWNESNEVMAVYQASPTQPTTDGDRRHVVMQTTIEQ